MGRALIKVEGHHHDNEECDGVGTMGLAGVCRTIKIIAEKKEKKHEQ